MELTLLSSAWVTPLCKGRIDIWSLTLDTLPCHPPCMNVSETARFDAFNNVITQRQFCASRTALRTILSTYLNCEPHQVEIKIEAGGKPQLESTGLPLFFNLTHSENRALLAVRLDHEIGIDIETLRDIPRAERIAQRIFSQNEIEQLKNSSHTQKLFLELWTRLEARQKCLGRGVFGIPVSEYEVESRIIKVEQGLCAAIAWPTQAQPHTLNLVE